MNPTAREREHVTADERALIQAIIAAPDDDLARLVYADWLDEHGQPERAHLIRVQCELARLRLADDPGFARYETLRIEERTILNRWAKVWIKEFLADFPTNRQTRVFFRRGMPGDLWCSAKYFVGNGSALFRNAPLMTVNILRPTAKALAEVAEAAVFGLVAGWRFWACRTPPEVVLAFLSLLPMRTLRLLDFSRRIIHNSADERTAWDAVTERIAGMPVLRHVHRLDLSSCGIGHRGAMALARSPYLDGVEVLNLNGNHLGKRSTDALRTKLGDRVCLSYQDQWKHPIEAVA
jgi:uncharacterized protein (TIGR02996 family)